MAKYTRFDPKNKRARKDKFKSQNLGKKIHDPSSKKRLKDWSEYDNEQQTDI
jgi:hypothetical protein